MSSQISGPLIALPVELQEQIVRYLACEELRKWSSTCRWYRALLSRRIFRHIAILSDERRALSVRTIAHGARREHVKILTFGDSDWGVFGEPICLDRIAWFRETQYEVLSQLWRFPNLEMLQIDLNFHSGGHWEGGDSCSIYSTAPREAVVRNTWAALAKNVSVCPKIVTIKHASYLAMTACHHHLHKRYLSTFFRVTESLFVSLGQRVLREMPTPDQGYNDGMHYWINERPIGPGILDHMSGLKNLRVSVDGHRLCRELVWRDHHVGKMGTRLTLPANHLPLLNQILLEGVLIDHSLFEALANLMGTLEKIIIVDCFCEESQSAATSYCWGQLLDMITERKPKKLRVLEISRICYPNDGQQPFGFPYGELKARFGGFGAYGKSHRANSKAYQLGQDRAAFERLMTIVKANSARRRVEKKVLECL